LNVLPNRECAILNIHNNVTNLKVINVPWNKTVTLQNISYEENLNMLRFRIQEGKRFTDLELDFQSLEKLNTVLSDWLAVNSG